MAALSEMVPPAVVQVYDRRSHMQVLAFVIMTGDISIDTTYVSGMLLVNKRKMSQHTCMYMRLVGISSHLTLCNVDTLHTHEPS